MSRESNAIHFEPLQARHAGELFSVLNDDELYAFIDDRPPRTVEALVGRFEAWESRRSPDGSQLWLNWVVRESRDRLAVGYVQATVEGRQAHVGYVIGKSYWGKGFATAAVAWLIGQLHSMNVDNIVATVEDRNQRSIRLLESLGFQQTRRRGTEIVFELRPDQLRTSARDGDRSQTIVPQHRVERL